MRTTLPPLVLLVLVAAGVAASGCGDTEARGQPPASGGKMAPAPTRMPAPVAQIAPAPPVAVREGRIDDVPVTVELAPLRRRGRVINLELRVRGKGADTTVDTNEVFDDGVAQHITDPSDSLDFEYADSLDGIGLVDGVHGRRYAPARDHFNRCVCDHDMGDVTISRRRPVAWTATFGAPPSDVHAVDVVIPGFGTVPDVPLG